MTDDTTPPGEAGRPVADAVPDDATSDTTDTTGDTTGTNRDTDPASDTRADTGAGTGAGAEDARAEDAAGPRASGSSGAGDFADDEPGARGLVRRHSWDVPGAVDLDLSLTSGRIEVVLSDEPGVHVELRHEPSAGNAWTEGLAGILNWVNDQFGAGAPSPAEAVRQARIDLIGQRVRVHAAKALPLRATPLAAVVHAPNGSRVEVHTGSATVTITGAAGRLDITNGTGDVSADRSDGPAQVTSGSGSVRLGPMLGGLRARTGSGELEVSSVGGETSLITGSGDVWLGSVQADVTARTGTGDLTVADAAHGRVHLSTGSGAIRVGIRSGVVAKVDLSSGSGQARSELGLHREPPAGKPTLWVRGRTGSGDAVVTPAVG